MSKIEITIIAEKISNGSISYYTIDVKKDKEIGTIETLGILRLVEQNIILEANDKAKHINDPRSVKSLT